MHDLEDGDVVTFSEVKGMEELNGKRFEVKVKSKSSLILPCAFIHLLIALRRPDCIHDRRHLGVWQPHRRRSVPGSEDSQDPQLRK